MNFAMHHKMNLVFEISSVPCPWHAHSHGHAHVFRMCVPYVRMSFSVLYVRNMYIQAPGRSFKTCAPGGCRCTK